MNTALLITGSFISGKEITSVQMSNNETIIMPELADIEHIMSQNRTSAEAAE